MRNSIPPGGGSEDKLWRLIEQRAQPGVDKAEIDRRIWDLFGERWAVMFTDLSGFSRGVAEFGITHFLQIIRDHRVLLAPILEAHDAIVLGQHADSMLVIFRHPRTALDCALAMQRKCQEVSRARRPEEKILLCLGLGYGDVLRASPFDVWGAEVNAASKLGEDIAKAHEILITGGMRDALGEIAGLSFVDLGKAPPGADRSFRVEYPRATPA